MVVYIYCVFYMFNFYIIILGLEAYQTLALFVAVSLLQIVDRR